MSETAEMLSVKADEPAEENEFIQDFGLGSAFALSFSNISPIVGTYSVFAISLVAAGPRFFWALPVVLLGQLLVTGVFGELVAKWPLQGSVYAWSRCLVGPKYGWFTNWAYMWGMILTLSVLALSAAGYVLGALGVGSPSIGATVMTGLAILGLASAANVVGGRLLKTLLYITLGCELVATIGIGTILMFFHRAQPFSVFFSGFSADGGNFFLSGQFLTVLAFTGYSFVGFESAGAIAEEVKEARKVLPTAISLSLAAVGLLVIFACAGILLAIPDLPAAISGAIADPIAATLETHLGIGLGRALLVVLAIGFTASLMAVQAAVSRTIWAAARDGVLPGARLLKKLSGHEHTPRHAIVFAAIIAGLLLFISTSKLYAMLLNAANAGFYVSYLLPVLGAVYVKRSGKWIPESHSLGRWSSPITYAAAAWLMFELANIAWPRPLANDWYINWALLLMTAAIGAMGYFVSLFVFRNHPTEGQQAFPRL